jgi:hypothetical protein
MSFLRALIGQFPRGIAVGGVIADRRFFDGFTTWFEAATPGGFNEFVVAMPPKRPLFCAFCAERAMPTGFGIGADGGRSAGAAGRGMESMEQSLISACIRRLPAA